MLIPLFRIAHCWAQGAQERAWEREEASCQMVRFEGSVGEGDWESANRSRESSWLLSCASRALSACCRYKEWYS